jgi:hypothetical protein
MDEKNEAEKPINLPFSLGDEYRVRHFLRAISAEAKLTPPVVGLNKPQTEQNVSSIFDGLSKPANSKYMLWGQAPQSYEKSFDINGVGALDGKRAFEVTPRDGAWSFIAGSVRPSENGRPDPNRENWFLNLAYTPLRTGDWRVGVMIGDMAQSRSTEKETEFRRVGIQAGLYATYEPPKSDVGAFVKIENDPRDGNKPRIIMGAKSSINLR